MTNQHKSQVLFKDIVKRDSSKVISEKNKSLNFNMNTSNGNNKIRYNSDYILDLDNSYCSQNQTNPNNNNAITPTKTVKITEVSIDNAINTNPQLDTHYSQNQERIPGKIFKKKANSNR